MGAVEPGVYMGGPHMLDTLGTPGAAMTPNSGRGIPLFGVPLISLTWVFTFLAVRESSRRAQTDFGRDDMPRKEVGPDGQPLPPSGGTVPSFSYEFFPDGGGCLCKTASPEETWDLFAGFKRVIP